MAHVCPLLLQRFCQNACDHHDQLALVIGDSALTYGQLHEVARRLADDLSRALAPEDTTIAVFCTRGELAYIAILATWMTGRVYVPVSPSTPAERNRAMLATCRSRVIVVDEAGASGLAAVVEGRDISITATSHPAVQLAVMRAPLGDHRVGSSEELVADSEQLAYIMFTSGSTGVPRGVAITEQNALCYVSEILEHDPVQVGDRFAQTVELTFDPSIHDMLVCWSAGATLLPLLGNARFAAIDFIRERRITHWTSVPSLAAFMKKMRWLRPGLFPDLRVSAFGGEALPLELAEAWQLAAPSTVIDNFYGPTETTIAVTRHRYSAESHNPTGFVPIGRPFASVTAVALDEAMRELPDGTPGELFVSGAQLAAGYYGDPVATAQKFITRPGVPGRWYRTGDLVTYTAAHGFLFLGRTDDQIKVSGHRIQLSDVEHAGRVASGCEHVVALGWPDLAPGLVGGIVLFVATASLDVQATLQACRALLPAYMVPRQVLVLAEFPLSTNGKTDRRALRQLLADGAA
jgi:amino acid adenylation domain-containing protein